VDYSDDPLPEDDVDGNGVPSEPTLKNMSWWDGVSYNSLERWVPTVGKVPADVHHGLALLRGAICRDMRLARKAVILTARVVRGSCSRFSTVSSCMLLGLIEVAKATTRVCPVWSLPVCAWLGKGSGVLSGAKLPLLPTRRQSELDEHPLQARMLELSLPW